MAEACDGADIALECTGVGRVMLDVIQCTAPAGVVCLAGVSSGTHHVTVDAAAVNREVVLQNEWSSAR